MVILERCSAAAKRGDQHSQIAAFGEGVKDGLARRSSEASNHAPIQAPGCGGK